MTSHSANPVRQFPVVRQSMTPSPFTIGPEGSLAAARELMVGHDVRHLPVLAAGHLVGLLSERDLLLVESLPGVNPGAVRVEEAMVQDVFRVAPDAPIAEVVGTMIDRKLGSAVVMEGEHVVGVFTTMDALATLHELLERP
jgi:acetoin utilization protein AcuB